MGFIGNNKKFVGIAIDGDVLKIAQVHYTGSKLQLSRLDRITLSESMEKKEHSSAQSERNNGTQEALNTESVFGIKEKEEESKDSDFEVLDEPDFSGDADLISFPEEDNSNGAQSNEILIHNLLADISTKRVNLGLNIPMGTSIFQILRDRNYRNLKKKDLSAAIDQRLQEIYDSTKSPNQYAYEVQEDGTLVLVSNENDIDLLNLVDESRDFYSGKIFINEILPDEAALIGLVRNNYTLKENEITGIILLGEKSTRLIFLKGKEVWLVAPVINEGTQSHQILNTIFSKILFQLNTGELPSLERIIIANNILGEKSTAFFKENFPDITVENLEFDEKLIDISPKLAKSVPAFSTAIGLAWAASGYKDRAYLDYSQVPAYVSERQKVFKLQWHGMLLLIMIALMPLSFNYFYQQNRQKIGNLHNQIQLTDSKINSIHSLAIGMRDLSQKYQNISQQLKRLDKASKGSEHWSKALILLNKGFKNINNCWLTSLRESKGSLLLKGYAIYRNRIPQITNLFADADLQDVKVGKLRTKKVYSFTIKVNKIY